MTLETILLAVGPKDSDRTDALAEAAIEVAGPAGADVVLLHVFTDDEYQEAMETLSIDADSESATPDGVASRHATIRAIGDALDEAGVDHESRGAVGDHADEIVAAAKDVGADRVIVGGRKRSPTGKAVFGSIAQDVMLSSPCPVTFVRGD